MLETVKKYRLQISHDSPQLQVNDIAAISLTCDCGMYTYEVTDKYCKRPFKKWYPIKMDSEVVSEVCKRPTFYLDSEDEEVYNSGAPDVDIA